MIDEQQVSDAASLPVIRVLSWGKKEQKKVINIFERSMFFDKRHFKFHL